MAFSVIIKSSLLVGGGFSKKEKRSPPPLAVVHLNSIKQGDPTSVPYSTGSAPSFQSKMESAVAFFFYAHPSKLGLLLLSSGIKLVESTPLPSFLCWPVIEAGVDAFKMNGLLDAGAWAVSTSLELSFFYESAYSISKEASWAVESCQQFKFIPTFACSTGP